MSQVTLHCVSFVLLRCTENIGSQLPTVESDGAGLKVFFSATITNVGCHTVSVV